MDPVQEQELQVHKDIQYLARTLTPDNLDARVMFAWKRSIRSCTPPFDMVTGNGVTLFERLKLVQPPPAE